MFLRRASGEPPESFRRASGKLAKHILRVRLLTPVLLRGYKFRTLRCLCKPKRCRVTSGGVQSCAHLLRAPLNMYWPDTA
eukprot:15454040-Alexandrium_andersonii.AAC.1